MTDALNLKNGLLRDKEIKEILMEIISRAASR